MVLKIYGVSEIKSILQVLFCDFCIIFLIFYCIYNSTNFPPGFFRLRMEKLQLERHVYIVAAPKNLAINSQL
jgi:hypothetical protein